MVREYFNVVFNKSSQFRYVLYLLLTFFNQSMYQTFCLSDSQNFPNFVRNQSIKVILGNMTVGIKVLVKVGTWQRDSNLEARWHQSAELTTRPILQKQYFADLSWVKPSVIGRGQESWIKNYQSKNERYCKKRPENLTMCLTRRLF